MTAKIGDDVIACESFNLTKGAERAAFAAGICSKRPGIDQATLEAELLKLAADLTGKGDRAEAAPSALPEVDTSRIVRPERFITPDVSGLAMPMMTSLGDKMIGRWLMYLRWAEGKRERRPLGPTIDVADGARLFVYPEASEPTPSMKPGWSASARRRWLDGEPAPNPTEVFRQVCERFAYFLDLPVPEGPGVTATLACWVMMTYSYSVWPAVPYLFVGGALGSGKSRTFEVLNRLAFRPLNSSSMTAPALFRTLHANGGTLLLDEAERLRDTKSPEVGELLSMLLAGYKRGGTATRLEPVGDSFRTVNFDVFGPKALACIAGLPPALASRCIPIIMFRAAPGSEKPRRRIDADAAGWQRLRDALHAMALEHGATWLELPARVDVCPEMTGRDYELWQPLLAIASWLEENGAKGLLRLMQEHALATIDAGKDDQVADADEVLLRLLVERRMALESPQPRELLEAAQAAEPNVFRSWSAKGVANALKRYGVTTAVLHGRRVYSRVTLSDLKRIEITYGLTLGLPENVAPRAPD